MIDVAEKKLPLRPLFRAIRIVGVSLIAPLVFSVATVGVVSAEQTRINQERADYEVWSLEKDKEAAIEIAGFTDELETVVSKLSRLEPPLRRLEKTNARLERQLSKLSSQEQKLAVAISDAEEEALHERLAVLLMNELWEQCPSLYGTIWWNFEDDGTYNGSEFWTFKLESEDGIVDYWNIYDLGNSWDMGVNDLTRRGWIDYYGCPGWLGLTRK